MGNMLEQTKEQLNEFYQRLDKKKKIKIGISGLFIIFTIATLIYVTSQPEYVTLFNNLELKDVGPITEKLDEMGIPWKDDETGTNILVPQEYKNKAKANLAMTGVPGDRFSYEDMLNNSSLTMTNEERTKRYQIAQMNNIAQTIEAIDGIKSSWVDLSIADDSNFLMKDQKSKASVFVELEVGQKLTQKQVNGIAMLVSNSVKDLEPEDVSIVNNKGEVLSKKEEGEVFDANTQFTLQQQVQKDLTESLTGFLTTVYGTDNVAVMVNVKLDFDSEETNVVEFSPPIEDETNGLVRSMTELKEKVINGDGQGGIPGTDSNEDEIPQYLENASNTSQYDKANKVVNYELNEIKKKIVKAQGQVKDVTIAVLINEKVLLNGELTDEQRKEVTELVSASAGLDTKVVKVMAREFDTSLADEFANAQKNHTDASGFAKIPSWAIAVLAILLIGAIGSSVYYVRQRKRNIEEVLNEEPIVVNDGIDEIEMELDKKSGYQKQINKLVDKNPEAVSKLLKTWLNED
ncbi:flagellar M-ring protein FliF [Lutibacter sp. B2]|nr:flagellar M-ring protein FliF [Lutibacter sp. B2]